MATSASTTSLYQPSATLTLLWTETWDYLCIRRYLLLLRHSSHHTLFPLLHRPLRRPTFPLRQGFRSIVCMGINAPRAACLSPTPYASGKLPPPPPADMPAIHILLNLLLLETDSTLPTDTPAENTPVVTRRVSRSPQRGLSADTLSRRQSTRRRLCASSSAAVGALCPARINLGRISGRPNHARPDIRTGAGAATSRRLTCGPWKSIALAVFRRGRGEEDVPEQSDDWFLEYGKDDESVSSSLC